MEYLPDVRSIGWSPFHQPNNKDEQSEAEETENLSISDLHKLYDTYEELREGEKLDLASRLSTPFVRIIDREMQNDATNFMKEHREFFVNLGSIFAHLKIQVEEFDSIKFIAKCCPNLKSLQFIAQSLSNPLPKQFKGLKKLTLKIEEIRQLDLHKFKDLESLEIICEFPIIQVLVGVSKLSNLQELTIHFSGDFGIADFHSLRDNLKGISKLKIIHDAEQYNLRYGVWDLIRLQEKLAETSIDWTACFNGQTLLTFNSSFDSIEGRILYYLKQGREVYLDVTLKGSPLALDGFPFLCDFRDMERVITPIVHPHPFYLSSSSNNRSIYKTEAVESILDKVSQLHQLFTYTLLCDPLYCDLSSRKNRYVDIVPYDQTIYNNLEGLNASRIKPIDGVERRLAQGPLLQTEFDFWYRLLSDSAGLVIMATDFVEEAGGEKKEKCSRYWFDDKPKILQGIGCAIQVTCTSNRSLKPKIKDCHPIKFRNFTIEYVERSEESRKSRKIAHIHIEQLGDGKAPNVHELMYLVRTIKHLEKQYPNADTTTWLLCSAGVGRSGLILACLMIDSMVQKSNPEQLLYFSPEFLLAALRLQRPQIIQTAEQLNALIRFFYFAVDLKKREHLKNLSEKQS